MNRSQEAQQAEGDALSTLRYHVARAASEITRLAPRSATALKEACADAASLHTRHAGV